MKTDTQAGTVLDWPKHPFTGRAVGWINAAEAAQVIGCRESMIAVLINERLLVPLGTGIDDDRKPNAKRLFAVRDIQRKLNDTAWLSQVAACGSGYDLGRKNRKDALAAQRRCRTKGNALGEAVDASPMPNQSSHAE